MLGDRANFNRNIAIYFQLFNMFSIFFKRGVNIFSEDLSVYLFICYMYLSVVSNSSFVLLK